MAHPVHVEVAGGPVQQLDLVGELVLFGLADEPGQSRVVSSIWVAVAALALVLEVKWMIWRFWRS